MVDRPLDNLGRLCIPIEYRRALGLQDGSKLAVQLSGNQIIMSKSMCRCCICGSEELSEKVKHMNICEVCLGSILGEVMPGKTGMASL